VSKIDPGQIVSAAIMFGSVIICCSLAYLFCRLLHFSSKVTGSVVLLSGFGTTSTLAYPLILQTFGGESTAMAYGLMIGEFGVCIPFFTLGVISAAYFGSRDDEIQPKFLPLVRSFFISPIFIAFVLGLIASQIPAVSECMSTAFCDTLFDYFKNALEMLVAISVGLMLRPVKIRGIVPVFILVAALKLLLQPVLVYAGAIIVGIPPLPTQILLIEASMPSGAVAAVVAARYGCEGSLASTIVVATFLLSLVTIPLVMILGL